MDKPNFNDVAQFLIAIVMIAGFIYLTNMLLLPATPSTDIIELLAAVFGGWIGAIIGFYFGQRPVRTLTESVEEKSRDIGARQQSIIALSAKVAELTKLLEEEPA